jgi:hypothetical protein
LKRTCQPVAVGSRQNSHSPPSPSAAAAGPRRSVVSSPIVLIGDQTPPLRTRCSTRQCRCPAAAVSS